MQKRHFIKNNLNSNVASINHLYVKSKKKAKLAKTEENGIC